MTRPSERLRNTKLSADPNPDDLRIKGLKLQNAEFQNAEPFKKIEKIASQLAGTWQEMASAVTPSPPTHTSTAKRNRSTSATHLPPLLKDSKGSQLAFNLFLVRPWVLVVGLWLVSMLSAGMALQGMISPKKLMMEMPQPTASTVPTSDKTAFLSVESGPNEGFVQSAEARKLEQNRLRAEAARANKADSDSFPTWPIGALVGTCAAGCLAISRRRTMLQLASLHSRHKPKGRLSPGASLRKPGQPVIVRKATRPGARPATTRLAANARKERSQRNRAPMGQVVSSQYLETQAATQTAASGATRQKKRRQRRQTVPVRKKNSALGSRLLISRTTAQSAAKQSAAKQLASASPPSASAQPVRRSVPQGTSRRQAVVSVVPASASHALDWTDGSLAHKLDVRPQRTAST